MKIVNGLIFGVVILFGVFFMTTSCKKTTTPTPVATPTPSPSASYTFNAMGVTATGVQYSILSGTQSLQITGSNATASGNGNEQTVVITINNAVNSTGSYTLNASVNNTGVYTSGGSTNPMKYSTGSSPYVGTLNITNYDATNRLMSVSFSFNAQEYSPNTSSSGTIYGSFANVGF
jgi:hypothetical protein